MDATNRRRHNANNNLRPNGIHSPRVQISSVVWSIGTQVLEMVFRMYLTVLVVIYQWSSQLVSRVLAPFQPAFDQARKVPKQDISLQGIVYQYLRLVFLLLLYFSPFLLRAGEYVLEPLRKLRDWAVDYVERPIDGATDGRKQTMADNED